MRDFINEFMLAVSLLTDARAASCLSIFSAFLRFSDQLETSNMKSFAISGSHLTQYRKFQWEIKAKEDYKPEKNGPELTRPH